MPYLFSVFSGCFSFRPQHSFISYLFRRCINVSIIFIKAFFFGSRGEIESSKKRLKQSYFLSVSKKKLLLSQRQF